MTATLVLTQTIAEEIFAAARQPLETAGVLLASAVHTVVGDIRLLARKIHWVSAAAYRQREARSLSISSEGYVPALSEAEALNATAIWIHTHPGPHLSPMPSVYDNIVDQEIADLFRLRTGSGYYGAIIFSPHAFGVSFTGHLDTEAGKRIVLERLWLVGERFRLLRSFDSYPPQLPPLFDRNVRAFGGGVQQALSDIRVGVVGCGGIGSAVAEQLVRLGVREFTLFDPDILSESNLTRVYGSIPSDVGRPKVDVLADHLTRIAPDVDCARIRSLITVEPTARHLTTCDVVFGCTDDNAGRLVLSRTATYLLAPVFDCGVLLSSDKDGTLTGIDGRVTTLVPGQACLVCRRRIDIARASAELMTPDERVRRENEGYAPGLGRIEPAVVPYTTLVAATAIGELLERFIGYGPEPRPSEVLLRYHEREMSTNLSIPRRGHYCHPSSGKLGIGITEPFLEQSWP